MHLTMLSIPLTHCGSQRFHDVKSGQGGKMITQ